MLANADDTVRNSNAGQAGAFMERMIVNGSNTVANGYTGQLVALIERRTVNAGDTVRDGNAGQAGAAIERTSTDNLCIGVDLTIRYVGGVSLNQSHIFICRIAKVFCVIIHIVG